MFTISINYSMMAHDAFARDDDEVILFLGMPFLISFPLQSAMLLGNCALAAFVVCPNPNTALDALVLIV